MKQREMQADLEEMPSNLPSIRPIGARRLEHPEGTLEHPEGPPVECETTPHDDK